jgi:hypothetical protein
MAVLGAACTCACAVIRIQSSSNEDVEVKTRFGIVSVELRPGAGTVLIDSRSFGAINAVDGFSVGYHSASFAAIARDGCHIVLWIRTDEQLKELNGLLRDRTDICVLSPESSKGGKP